MAPSSLHSTTYAALWPSGTLASTALISPGPNPVAVLLCLGLLIPGGPTGARSLMGADVLGLRSLVVVVEAMIAWLRSPMVVARRNYEQRKGEQAKRSQLLRKTNKTVCGCGRCCSSHCELYLMLVELPQHYLVGSRGTQHRHFACESLGELQIWIFPRFLEFGRKKSRILQMYATVLVFNISGIGGYDDISHHDGSLIEQ
jgi:hypothetical protein